jgi:hypothetical protein
VLTLDARTKLTPWLEDASRVDPTDRAAVAVPDPAAAMAAPTLLATAAAPWAPARSSALSVRLTVGVPVAATVTVLAGSVFCCAVPDAEAVRSSLTTLREGARRVRSVI